MTLIAHISDLHFGASNTNREERLLEQLNVHLPDLAVITGDITQRATRRQYAAAHRFLRRLPCPCMTIPGNHDLTLYNMVERFHHPWRKWHRYISTDVEPETAAPHLSIMGINTAAPWGYRMDWSRGRILRHQIERIENRFRQVSENHLRVIAAHHPLWLPRSERHRRLAGGTARVFPSLKSSGVDLVLGGHTHSAYVHIENGMIICHAGSAFSNRLSSGQENSYTLISGNHKGLNIKIIQWQTNDFKVMESYHFARQSNGWQIQ